MTPARSSTGSGPGSVGVIRWTTLLAVATVSAFALAGEGLALGDRAVLPGDLRTLSWSAELRTRWLTGAAKVVTDIGSLPVAGGALVLAAVFLLLRREPLASLALLVGLGLTFAGVHLIKAMEDRPRPPAGLVRATGSAFPSGHAAYAVAFVAIAVALRHATPSPAGRAMMLPVAVGVTLIVGLTRTYLRVHWLSDVVGGWALGAGCFALTGTLALVVADVRQNVGP